jgi:ankyrin repeat protein
MDNFFNAVHLGDYDEVNDWLDSGADPDEEQEGMTALFIASTGRDVSMIKLLVSRGADVNQDGDYPLHCAVANALGRDCDVIETLLNLGARVNGRDQHVGRTPLMTARGDYRVTRLLLRRGASVNLCDNEGKDAADYASEFIGPSISNHPALALLADVRAAGGTWTKYLREPRYRMLKLRILCDQGRATAPGGPVPSWAAVGLLPRLFSAAMPKEVLWIVLAFWRTDRDD